MTGRYSAADRGRVRKEDCSKGGRPPLDVARMFKIAMLRHWNNISDDSTERLVDDRPGFRRFPGMEPGEKSPGAKTVWLFKEKPGEGGMREMFGMFNRLLEKNGTAARAGSIVDASFVDAPKQRSAYEENKTIKNGGMPEERLLPRNAAKTEQKDTDARRAKKARRRVSATRTA